MGGNLFLGAFEGVGPEISTFLGPNGTPYACSHFTLLQALTLISCTQTGCHRLDSYIQQKKFMPFVPAISAEFSAPPEFSDDVLVKDLSTGWARTSDLQITNQKLFHCATASLYIILCSIHDETFRPFFQLLAAGFSSRVCFYQPGFPAVSVVNGRDFPAVSAVTGRRIFRRCAAKAIFYCPTMNSHRPRSQNTAKEQALIPEKVWIPIHNYLY